MSECVWVADSIRSYNIILSIAKSVYIAKMVAGNKKKLKIIDI